MSLAQRLDAADGVIDGRYFGRPIVEARAPYAATTTYAAPAVTSYGPAVTSYGASYGAPAGYRTSTAAALDAADGVIDGRYFGRPIVETSGLGLSRSLTRGGYYGGRYYGGASILRGGYYGGLGYPASASVLRAGYYGSPASISRVYGSRYAGYGGLAGGYRTSTAAALDAADGVIDGRYFGRPIVETAPTYAATAYAAPAYAGYSSAYPVVRRGASVTRYGGYTGYGGSVTRLGGYGGYGGYRTTAAYAPGYRTSTAAALDAADGVIDGRYFGRPIVETAGAGYGASRVLGGTTYGGYRGAGSLAERLDAADGVIDGRYFGRRIVQA